jgi:hypothetical protein
MLPIALIVVFAIVFTPTPWTRSDYHTLSRTESASGDVNVMFKEHTNAAQMRAVLAAIQGEIVAGPNAAGVYAVRLRDRSPTNADRESLLATLRRDPAIALAMPVLPARNGDR